MNETIIEGVQIGLGDCCHEPIYDNNHFCPNCGDVPCYLICEICMSEGEIENEVCPDCVGERHNSYFNFERGYKV